VQTYVEKVISHIYESLAWIQTDNPTRQQVKAALGLYGAALDFLDGFRFRPDGADWPDEDLLELQGEEDSCAAPLQKILQAYIRQYNLPPHGCYSERIGPWIIQARPNGAGHNVLVECPERGRSAGVFESPEPAEELGEPCPFGKREGNAAKDVTP